MTGPLTFRLGWPLYAGMTVAGAAAIVASASTLAALARAAGWAGWTPWLLPAALDVGGSVGGWCWLRPGTPQPARGFGRVVALLGAALTLVGNAAGHLLATGYLHPGPLLVVVVGAVPAAVLVALAHLAALLATQAPDDAPPAADEPTADVPPLAPSPKPRDTGRKDRTDDGTDTRTAVLAVIRRRPVTIADLVQTTGRSRTTIVGHLSALIRDGAVVRDDDKRYRAVTRPHLVDTRVETVDQPLRTPADGRHP